MKSIIAALLKAQSEVTGAKKDSTNPHFKSEYASLESVIDAVKGPLNRNGIVFVQCPFDAGEGRIGLKTILMHESGSEVVSESVAPLDKQNAQSVGSALTYLRRYSLMAMVGIAPADDDGEATLDTPVRQARREEGGRQMPDHGQNAPKRAPAKPSGGSGGDDISRMSDDEIRAEVGQLLWGRCVGDFNLMAETLEEFTAFANVPGVRDVEDMVVGQPKWTRKRLENVLRQARKQWQS